MAGIGIELRKLLRKNSYTGLLQAYGYAGIISSGPWILSIVGVIVISLLSSALKTPAEQIIDFLVSLTYLSAFSLISGSWLQLLLTRFMADRFYDESLESILPNLIGALFITTVTNFIIGISCFPLFADTTLLYRCLMLSCFIILSDIWILVMMISGLREYKQVVLAFFMSYSITIGLCYLLNPYGLEGLLAGFMLGQSIMLFWFLGIVALAFPAKSLMSFEFLDPNKAYYSLAVISVFYNLGIWADKLVFWFNPITSISVIGPLRSSEIYDPPIFLAYLSIIPGMAVFLLRMEADFVERCQAYYSAIMNGKTLNEIRDLRFDMMATIRSSFIEIVKVQMLTMIILILNAEAILSFFDISTNYKKLLAVDIIAVGLQVVLLSLINILFYLDKRPLILKLILLFALSNFLLTWLSLSLPPEYYGFGFAAAIVITTLTSFIVLNKTLSQLEYETFMLQK